jgi:hypothetical protein
MAYQQLKGQKHNAYQQKEESTKAIRGKDQGL